MFVEVIQSQTKSKSGKIYETVLVRESIRTPGGPRSRTIGNLSGLPPQTRELIANSLKGPTLVSPRGRAVSKGLS